jgi:hypothetical protein
LINYLHFWNCFFIQSISQLRLWMLHCFLSFNVFQSSLKRKF